MVATMDTTTKRHTVLRLHTTRVEGWVLHKLEVSGGELPAAMEDRNMATLPHLHQNMGRMPTARS